MRLLKDLWEQIRGNFKYEILRFGAFWVVTTVGAGMIATFLGVASRWAHRPATNLDLFLIFGTTLLVALCVGWVSRSKRPSVGLTAHGNASSELILSVKNNGAEDVFCAEAQLVERNIHNNFKRMPFSLLWKESDDKGLLIPKDRSADLKIATYHDKGALGLIDSWSAMRFDGVDELAIWGQVDRKAILPTYVMRVSVFSKSSKIPHSVHFQVGPETCYGPLRMIECKVPDKEATV